MYLMPQPPYVQAILKEMVGELTIYSTHADGQDLIYEKCKSSPFPYIVVGHYIDGCIISSGISITSVAFISQFMNEEIGNLTLNNFVVWHMKHYYTT